MGIRTYLCAMKIALIDNCLCLQLQVVEPDASKKDVYEAAFQRHYQIGKQIFEP